MHAVLLSTLPPLLCGAMCSAWVAFSIFPVKAIVVVIWTVFYGLALLAGTPFVPRSVVWLGLAFITFGVLYGCVGFWGHLVFLRVNEAMALSFGLFHLAYAAAVWRRSAVPSPA
jgi:hypothetical protein